ncbi:hypothetical protein H2200_011903 [Cladophialophora chaetospira]|uniref:Uncharacterized protein n=1 Tax=Cladophialophora chaetospira TaxID=386627 RepID=A0AA38WYX0_9EURO|nr:hypothetical protein H2200_011903 [Cladophialophora chaetospira]
MRRVTSGRSRGDSPVDEFKMRAKSLLLLQQELRKHPEHSPKALATVQSHVRMLFKGECMSQDVNAAKVHAQTFLKLDDQFMDEIEHAHHALVVMYSVTELACKRLERTIIPFGIYLINAISNFWTATSCQLPQASAGTEKVHACLTNPWLRNAFLRTRYCLSIEEGSIPSTTPAERLRGDMLFGWIATWTFFDMGTLMNIYIDLIEEEVPTDSEGKQLVEACLILTFLHVLRKCIHEAPINGVDLRDASQVMIPRLQMDLQRALRTLKPREYLYYNDAILWMLYIGAVHERGLRPGNLVARDEAASGAQTWFTRTFAKQAYKMNIWTWADALAVLSQFIYSEHLCPPGHLWFDEVICA